VLVQRPSPPSQLFASRCFTQRYDQCFNWGEVKRYVDGLQDNQPLTGSVVLPSISGSIVNQFNSYGFETQVNDYVSRLFRTLDGREQNKYSSYYSYLNPNGSLFLPVKEDSIFEGKTVYELLNNKKVFSYRGKLIFGDDHDPMFYDSRWDHGNLCCYLEAK